MGEENRRWQERNSQPELLTNLIYLKVCLFICLARSIVLFLRSGILTHVLQYDRIDPTEFQSLKDEIESLKGEKSAWET
jgi:hypothetical protein